MKTIKKNEFRCMICQEIHGVKAGSQIAVKKGPHAKLGYIVFTCRKFACKEAAANGQFGGVFIS